MLILRSICVGIAFLVAALFVGVPVMLTVATYYLERNSGHQWGGEVGWDLVTMAHNSPVSSILLPLLIFALGFIFGFRYFSKSMARK
jgi:hypothetical protein